MHNFQLISRTTAQENAGYKRTSVVAHPGQVGRDGVCGVPVEVRLGHVVTQCGARVGVAHGVLHVPDSYPGDEAGRKCSVPTWAASALFA